MNKISDKYKKSPFRDDIWNKNSSIIQIEKISLVGNLKTDAKLKAEPTLKLFPKIRNTPGEYTVNNKKIDSPYKSKHWTSKIRSKFLNHDLREDQIKISIINKPL